MLASRLNPSVFIDETDIQDLLFPPPPLGLTTRSFVQPNVELSATASGEVEFFGFDLAELYGGVTFTVFLTYGLDTLDETEVIPFDEFFSRSCFSIDGQLGLVFGADALGINIFEVEHFFPQFNIANIGCDNGILTHTGPVANEAILQAMQSQLEEDPYKIKGATRSGSSMSSAAGDRDRRKHGAGMYVQVHDLDLDPDAIAREPDLHPPRGSVLERAGHNHARSTGTRVELRARPRLTTKRPGNPPWSSTRPTLIRTRRPRPSTNS